MAPVGCWRGGALRWSGFPVCCGWTRQRGATPAARNRRRVSAGPRRRRPLGLLRSSLDRRTQLLTAAEAGARPLLCGTRRCSVKTDQVPGGPFRTGWGEVRGEGPSFHTCTGDRDPLLICTGPRLGPQVCIRAQPAVHPLWERYPCSYVRTNLVLPRTRARDVGLSAHL